MPNSSHATWRFISSADADLVAQLVLVVGTTREMPGQHASDLGDAGHHGLQRPALAEPRDHQVAHGLPVRVADVMVNALVADDGELAVLDGEIDQHAVALCGEVHAEMGEHPPGPAKRVGALQ